MGFLLVLPILICGFIYCKDGTEDRCTASSRADEIGSLFSISLLQKNIVSMTFFEGDYWQEFKKNEVRPEKATAASA
ncbi:hypothetical protein [Pseudomonas shirazensis]|uniref:hypothetical protein n=1 Tax=Pseudomonas shirazensis TaxID=2745494 RepID=UPI003985E885